MSGHRQCIFVAGRPCPFPEDEIPLQTCQVCIEAWKTDLTVRARAETSPMTQRTVTLTDGRSMAEVAATQARLKEIDELFEGGQIEPGEYVRLRKEEIERLMLNDEPALRLDGLDGEAEHLEPRQTRVTVVVKSLFGNRVYTYPPGWKLPETISDAVIDQMFKLANERPTENIRIGVCDHKVACIRHAKGKMALLVMDMDEAFETYEAELVRLSRVFEEEKGWLNALKEMG